MTEERIEAIQGDREEELLGGRPRPLPARPGGEGTMRRFLLPFLLAALLAGCDYLPFGFTEIGKIETDPTSFEGKEVKVRGEVTGTARIPFLDSRMYTVSDATGEILVFTSGELPRQGEKVAVAGKVESAAIIGGESFGVRIREMRRLPGFLGGSGTAKPEGKEKG